MSTGFNDFYYSRLTVRRYELRTRKLRAPLRLAHISDLHCCLYGEGQSGLLAAVRALDPDAVMMTGDMIDERYPPHATFQFLRGLNKKYPAYYVIGNHEVRTGAVNLIKSRFARYGVITLAGGHTKLFSGGRIINICGVDDPESEERRFEHQLEAAFNGINSRNYTVLLSHRPERFSLYSEYPCDLVLSGHAHGGQWRLPPFLNGLYAPDQGLFPKLAGGFYKQKTTSMIVSRGLARESSPFIPRFFNPPELVAIDILPDA